jgi:hypothetical protein
MCNLVDAFMEEQYQDPEFLAWLEQKNKQMTDQMEDHYNSIEYARDAIAAEMNNQLMEMTYADVEREYKSLSEWELLNEL